MLNGWQRLWVVLTVLWLLLQGSFLFFDGPVTAERVRENVAVGTIVPLVLYALGAAVGWIWRGFRSTGQAPQR